MAIFSGRNPRVLVATSVIGALILVAGVAAVSDRRRVALPSTIEHQDYSSIRIQDDAGRPVPSVYDGVRRSRLQLSAYTQLLRCSSNVLGGKALSAFDKLTELLSIRVVHAQPNCQVTGCSGHYYYLDTADCPPACEGPVYYRVFADSSMAPYDIGWQYDGTYDCGSSCATCSVNTCDNP